MSCTQTTTGQSSARYYNSDLSIWLSVDPMVDKYPNLSPYTYCANNPVRIFDEDGREVCYGGDPLKSHAKFEHFFYKKIAIPLENKAKSGADLSELEAEAASLAKQYQKKLLRGYGSTKTDWNGKEMIDIKVFSETKEKIKVASRPDNQDMIICDEIPLEADVYAAEVDFAPYGVENYATFMAANIIETGWINSTNGNSLSYNLEVNGASSITYCIQNKLADKKQDNWSFTVTLHRRKLDIRMESRIVDYRYKGK